jgi:peptidoglycan/xylan/chitin deacetylase (PgdA/CDA1 family)
MAGEEGLSRSQGFRLKDPAEERAAEYVCPWPQGKRAGLSLTFDDARTSQVDLGAPVLGERGLKATFYALPSLLEHRAERWKEAFAEGHEVGNHTVTHPCSCNFAFSRDNALEDYTLERMQEELARADEELEAFFGVRPTSFAYPCGQRYFGRAEATQSYVPLVAERFIAGRGFLDQGPNDPLRCDMAQLNGVDADEKDFGQLKAIVDANLESGTWLVLVAHNIGRPGPQSMPLDVLRELCRYVAALDELWVDTVTAIGSHLAERRGGRGRHAYDHCVRGRSSLSSST